MSNKSREEIHKQLIYHCSVSFTRYQMIGLITTLMDELGKGELETILKSVESEVAASPLPKQPQSQY